MGRIGLASLPNYFNASCAGKLFFKSFLIGEAFQFFGFAASVAIFHCTGEASRLNLDIICPGDHVRADLRGDAFLVVHS